MEELKDSLHAQRIYSWSALENHIQCVRLLQEYIIHSCCQRCFPHIVNIASQAVLTVMTNIDLATETADFYEPEEEHCDVIATLRTVVRIVSELKYSKLIVC